ncbi:uncharacterized protein LOC131935853 [Physella acuta]|uniref:uncharacterized protein LOC131935853 n=1 Tax=Physella acuta TaxID=109671 RepID=UPI0027DD9015|nr:uncharacterized protein LOC131935853 [Physella acuta]XP_059148537.1 uncharacterized protein LOC131935853 [Physella acuta]XP_059148538.1 uncharacterized protein LOC131935853 [Physella acuta]XP_059148539.1 uncharacterized protein LOC131935853 [Physella acuta]
MASQSTSSSTDMDSIDLLMLLVEWYRNKTGLRRYFDFSFQQLKLEIVEQPPVHWIASIPDDGSSQTVARTVEITCAGKARKSGTKVYIEKNSDNRQYIQITRGKLTKMNETFDKTVRLELPTGDHVYLDPTDDEIDIPMDVNPTFGSVYCPYPASSMATIRSKENGYKGRFTCCLLLRGRVICNYNDKYKFPVTDEQDIEEIMRDLKMWNNEDADQFILCNGGGDVEGRGRSGSTQQ